jgi:hypothetical protein
MLLTQAAVMLNVVGRNREVLRTPLLSGTTAKDNPFERSFEQGNMAEGLSLVLAVSARNVFAAFL